MAYHFVPVTQQDPLDVGTTQEVHGAGLAVLVR